MSHKQVPFWEGMSENRIWDLKFRQPLQVEVIAKDGIKVYVGHDLDITSAGALVIKRILGRGPKITAWGIVKAWAPGEWLQVTDQTPWSEMVVSESAGKERET